MFDLEGSGNPGVLAICNYLPEPSALTAPMSDELFYFGPEGRIRWTYSLRPDLIDFNGKPIEAGVAFLASDYSAPWERTDPLGGSPAWVALAGVCHEV